MTAFISNHILDIVFCLLTLSGGIAATILLDRKANQTHSYQFMILYTNCMDIIRDY